MKNKIKEWVRTKGADIAEKWVIFLTMMLTAIVFIMLGLPIAILFVLGGIAYMILAGLAAILNEIFYHKPVDETFEELFSKFIDKIVSILEI